ncbi:LytR family transcriptional regulator [Leucobacter sp. OH2974_COT-288]|nr:LytR family transcriptional regulator [Leucobacter sp. OH2974_COT-288]
MSQKQNFPSDRFDAVSVGGKRGSRIGAHRADPRQRYFGRWALLVFSMTLLCTLAGVLWLMRVGADSTVFSSAKDMVQQEQTAAQAGAADAGAQTAAEPEPEPEPEPAVNPEATVTVLNGTLTAGLAGGVGEEITANAWGAVTFVGNARTQDVAVTTVVYSNQEQAANAAALARVLGGVESRFDLSYADYGTDLVVEVGADRAVQ